MERGRIPDSPEPSAPETRPHARRRRRRAVFAVVAAGFAASACERPQLPLEYMRRAVAPPGAQSPLAGREAPEPRRLDDDLPPPVVRDWDSLQARDTVAALLTFNSTGYFIHRGEPMGFEYELLEAFAEAHDLILKTVVVSDRRDLFGALNRGDGDVVAARLVSVPAYRDAVRLTGPLYTTRPVVVQRAPDSASARAAEAAAVQGDTAAPGPAGEEGSAPGDSAASGGRIAGLPDTVRIGARLLRRPAELAGEEVHVPAGSDYYSRIVEISDSVGESIELVEVEEAEQVEPLIEAVAEGRIRLTVSQENLAELNQARFTNLVVKPVLGADEAVVWAVRNNAPGLQAELDRWLRSDEGEQLKAVLYTKYFVDRNAYRRRVEDEYFAAGSGQISPYDSLLSRYASGLGWDWRLLAAQVAQESRFDPSARSWAGARGLLQLMPRTAREMGVRNPTDPDDNIRGGVKYLGWLTGLWSDEVPDEAERLKFILASYNAGRGHVLDAQRLAEKHGDDPLKWDDVAYWLLQKSKRSVYRDPVVRHGYVRGLEPVQYVSKILARYDRYRNIEE